MDEAWIVLGASSPISRAFAFEVAKRGAGLVLAGRDLDEVRRIASDLVIRTGARAEARAFDAADFASHDAFVQACRGCCNRINLFLAVGAMPRQEDADRDFAQARAAIEANYLGAVSVLSRFAPVIEAQKGGKVIVLGSVAGDRGRASNYLYGSSKAALAVYTEGLNARLWRAGATVTLVKLGYIDTDSTWGLDTPLRPAPPEACARFCLRAAERGAISVYYPPLWALAMGLLKALPGSVFRRLRI